MDKPRPGKYGQRSYCLQLDKNCEKYQEVYSQYSAHEIMQSGSSGTSRLSACSSRARETRLAAAKATLIQQQSEGKKRKTVELEVKRVELEIK